MPPRKRAKKTQSAPVEEPAQQVARRNVRGRRGGLKDMPEMPLDILIEIFGFMHPRDLLVLARTSKPFRALLMSRTSQAFWKASINGVQGLPKCPPYMSEPAYINLLFFPHCHGCLKPNVQKVTFEFGARYCNGCKPKMIVSSEHITLLYEDIRAVTGAGAVGQLFALIQDGYKLRCHKPDLDAFRAQWDSLPDNESRKVLVETYRSRVKMMQEVLPTFRKWQDNQKSKRSVELHQIKANRFESIKAKLRQAGWAEELSLMSSWRLSTMKDKFASKAEPLTERGWQKIRDSVVAYMEDIKRRRLDAARKVVLRGRLELFVKAHETYRGEGYKRTAESDLGPHLMDLAVTECFKAILDAPDDADMSILNDAEAMRITFENALDRWQTSRRLEFATMVAKSMPKGAEPAPLTSVLFACSRCKRTDLRYPTVIGHLCNRAANYDEDIDIYASTVTSFWSSSFSRSPWRSSYLSVSTQAMSALPNILCACGLDPVHTTFKQMDECQARLTCTRCSVAYSGKIAGPKTRQYTTYYTHDCWSALSRSYEPKTCFSQGKPAQEHQWARVSTSEEQVIAQLRDSDQHKANDEGKWLHGCCYCDYAARPRKMTRHLAKHHDITVEVQDIGAHAYKHYDGKPKPRPLLLKRFDDGTASAEYDSAFDMGLLDYDEYDYDSDIGLAYGLDMSVLDSDNEYDFDFA